MTSTDDTATVIDELLTLLDPPETDGRRGVSVVRSLATCPTLIGLVDARLKAIGSEDEAEGVVWALMDDAIQEAHYDEGHKRRPLLAARYLLAAIPSNPAALERMVLTDTGQTLKAIVKSEKKPVSSPLEESKHLRQLVAVAAGRYGRAFNRLSSKDATTERNLEEVAGELWAALSERLYDNARLRRIVGLPSVEETGAPSPEIEAARASAAAISAKIQRHRDLDTWLTAGAIVLGLAILILLAIFAPILTHEWGWDQVRINVGAGETDIDTHDVQPDA